MKRATTFLLIVMLFMSACAPAPAVAQQPTETTAAATIAPTLTPTSKPTLAPTPKATPEPTPEPLPAPTPAITDKEWRECFDIVSHVLKIDAVNMVEVDFTPEKDGFYIFINLKESKENVSDEAPNVLIAAATAALTETAMLYDDTIKPIGGKNYFGGLYDYYNLVIDISDENYDNVATVYIKAGTHKFMFI